MNNLCMGGGGQFVSRDEVALIQTPRGTASWKPVSHIDVIDSVIIAPSVNPDGLSIAKSSHVRLTA